MGVFQAAQSQGEMNVYLARRHIYTLVNCATVQPHGTDVRSSREISNGHSHALNLRRSLIVSHLDASF